MFTLKNARYIVFKRCLDEIDRTAEKGLLARKIRIHAGQPTAVSSERNSEAVPTLFRKSI